MSMRNPNLHEKTLTYMRKTLTYMRKTRRHKRNLWRTTEIPGVS